MAEKASSPTFPVPARDLSVGQVSERSGLPVSTIHFYEAKGLIASRRTGGNQRRYARAVMRRLAVIKVAQSTGIPLAEIAAAFKDVPADHVLSTSDWERLSRRWKSELDRRIEKLVNLRDHLSGCIGCGCLSLKSCPLRNPDDIAAKDGPGARQFD